MNRIEFRTAQGNGTEKIKSKSIEGLLKECRDLKKRYADNVQFMEDLRLLNVTRETLFPGLDEAAKAVAQRYFAE